MSAIQRDHTTSVDEIADGYTRKHPGTRIVRNYGASGTLAKQIESGAPADIFVSANEEWMGYLKQRRLVSSSETLACNTLVFAGSTGKKVTGMHDLPALDRIALGSPGRATSRIVGSRVANSRFSANTSALVSRLNSVDLPALV